MMQIHHIAEPPLPSLQAAADAATQATPGTIATTGVAAVAGPWQITVLEVVQPDAAAAAIAGTNDGNPAAPEGLQYMLVRVSAQNMSTQNRAILLADFGAAADDGIVRRPPSIEVPSPALQAVVAAGESAEGWIPLLVSAPGPAILRFDSPLTNSTWAQATFALGDASARTGSAPPAAGNDATDIGQDPASPAAIGQTVRTGGFDVTVQDVIYGQEVFDRSDGRVQALGSGYGGIGEMVAVHVAVTNVSAFPAFFSTSALQIADPGGAPWDHTLALTPPEPDVSREYLPGASGEGWASFELPAYGSPDLIRILPFAVGGSPRYVAFDGGGIAADGSADEDTAGGVTGAAAGDIVRTSEDLVNLRAEPATDAEVVEELPQGTALTVTGDPVDADDYTWLPVDVVESGNSGYVAEDFVEAP